MTRILLFLISRVTPRIDRDGLVGDTLERFDEIVAARSRAQAHRWLWRETARVLLNAPRHHLAARRAVPVERFRKDAAMSSLWQDLRFAVRWLGRSPGFAAVAVLTLALGIGANTAMFAVVNAVLLKPLPFADADRLMLVHLKMPALPGEPGPSGDVVWSYPKYRTFLDVQNTFDESGLFSGRATTISGSGEAERLQGEVVTDRYLSTLGVQPVLGRAFTADEANRKGGQPVAILGHGLWTRRYAADPGIVGRTVQLAGVTHTIVGVLPRGFRGLSGSAEVWTPLAITDAWALDEPQGHEYSLVARRRSEVSEAAAATAMRAYGAQIDAAYPQGPGRSWNASAVSLDRSRANPDVRRVALVILGAVGFVLLIACVNLTNLLATKASTREREIAIRLAIGASRGRVIRQFAIEGLTLAAIGTAGGLAVALGLLSIAAMIFPEAAVFARGGVAPGMPRIAGADGLTQLNATMIGLDTATFLFTGLVGLLTAVLVSLLPAVQASGLQPGLALKPTSSATSGPGSGRFGSRGFLAAVEIALALVLMTGAALMLKSAWHLRGTRLGIDANHVMTAGMELPTASYAAERGTVFYADLIDRLRAVPGVEAVGVGSCAPVSGACNATSISFPPRPPAKGAPPVGVRWVTPGYFDALRIPLLQGRAFGDLDRRGQPKVVLVNQTAARLYWPNDNPIGKRVAIGQGGFNNDGAEVIGVVGDVRYRSIESAATPDVYLPLAQSYRANLRIFVRSTIGPGAVATLIAQHVHAIDGNLPLIGIKTMEDSIGDAMWRTRIAALLLSAFAALALLLTGVGVFGVMAQSVSQRTFEFGVRLALGAKTQDILSLVLRRGVIVTMGGLILGVVGSFGATRIVRSLLYGVEPNDPGSLMAGAFLLGLVSLLACYIPARRATRVDAAIALRGD